MNKVFGFYLIFSILSSTWVFADSKYPFSRLFTSSEERQWLDELREKGSVNVNAENTNVNMHSTAVNYNNRKVKLSGVLITEGGKRVVWVDGRSELSKKFEPEKVKVVPSLFDKDKVTLKVDKKLKHLKPGQVWLVDDNNLKEGYEVKPELSMKVESSTDDADKGVPINVLLDKSKSIQAEQKKMVNP